MTSRRRYSVWGPECPNPNCKVFFTSWRTANQTRIRWDDRYGHEHHIWDHSTTPPTDVTENNPEGPHMATPHPGKRTPEPTIPMAVKELTIRRHDYKEGQLQVVCKGDMWHMTISCTDAEVLTRIHEVAAAMEAVK